MGKILPHLLIVILLYNSCSILSQETNINQPTNQLIIGNWISQYADHPLSLEFTESTYTLKYDKPGFKEKTSTYSFVNDTLLDMGTIDRSQIQELSDRTLILRPITKELKEDISLIHAVTFKRVE